MMQAKLSPEETEKLEAAETPEANTPEPAPEAEAAPEAKAPAPTWFALTENRYVPDRPSELAERYRRTPLPLEAFDQADDAFETHYRRMTGYEPPYQKTREWRPPTSGKMAPIPPRPTLSRRHIAAQDAYYGNRRRAHEPIEREGGLLAGLSLGKSFLLASCFAVIAGAAAGFGITRIGDLPSGQEVAAMLGGGFIKTSTPAPEQQQATGKSAIEVAQPIPAATAGKPISIATLNVEDAVGTLNSSIPLLLHAEPGSESEPIALKIMGLPETAYLTAGTRVEGNAWLLSPGQEEGVKLVVPASEQPNFDVSVAAIETKSGELAAPVKELTVALDDPSFNVTPANAPPEVQTASTKKDDKTDVPASETEQVAAANSSEFGATPSPASDLLSKGDTLLQAGDLAGARQFFEKAYASGSPEGALGAGKTFDPAVYAELNVQGMKPDPAKALEWYKKAQLSGARDAAAEIQRLESGVSLQ
jgi:hypothetical protein